MAIDNFEDLRTISHCVYCGKRRGLLVTFTKHGFCDKCNQQVRKQITNTMETIKICESRMAMILDTAARPALVDAVRQIEAALVLIDNLEVIRPKVPFFTTGTAESRKQLNARKNRMLEMLNSPANSPVCRICKQTADNQRPLTPKGVCSACTAESEKACHLIVQRIADHVTLVCGEASVESKKQKLQDLRLCIDQLHIYDQYIDIQPIFSSADLEKIERTMHQLSNLFTMASSSDADSSSPVSTSTVSIEAPCCSASLPVVEQTFFVKKEYNKTKKLPHSFIIADLETTGLSPETEQIIEIGAIQYVDGIEVARFSTLVKPTKSIPAGASRVNHIYDKTVEDAPPIEDALPSFVEFIGKSPLVFHNAPFDMSFLQTQLYHFNRTTLDNPVIDTLWLARKHLTELPNHKLDTIKNHFGCAGVSHRAVEDCVVTAHLYLFCIGNTPDIDAADEPPAAPSRDYFQSAAKPADYEEAKVTYDEVDEIVFAEHSFVVTGDVQGYTRPELKQLVERLGGKLSASPSKKTDYLVVGMQNKNVIKDTVNVKSTKIINAENLRAQGEKIQIISDELFLSLIEGVAHELTANV